MCTCIVFCIIKCKKPSWVGDEEPKGKPKCCLRCFLVPNLGPRFPWGQASFSWECGTLTQPPFCLFSWICSSTTHLLPILKAEFFQKEWPPTSIWLLCTFWIIIMIWAKIVLLLAAFSFKVLSPTLPSKDNFWGAAPLFPLPSFKYKGWSSQIQSFSERPYRNCSS